MASSQMYAPSKTSVAGRGLNTRFTSSNPFEALETVVEGKSDGRSSTGSPTSSGGSLSNVGHNDSRGDPMTPSRGHVDAQKLQAMQQPVPTTPQHVDSARRMTGGGDATPSSFISPPHARVQAVQQYDGSPQIMTPNRLTQLQGSGMPRRNSHASQSSENWRSPRTSISSSSRTMPGSADVFNAIAMSAIPEYNAVQEVAFRQGQQDRSTGGIRNTAPSSPFGQHLDHVWAQYYKLGMTFGGEPAGRLVAPSSRQNFTWPVLINPATQDMEHPNGSVDMEWARKVCEIGLACMQELIRLVCKRGHDWRKIVCDIPAPTREAMRAFPDLCEYYEILKQDAHEALNDGRPMGY